MPKHYTIIGYPVGHSLSPLIHGAWFQHYHLNATYTRTPCTLEQLATTIPALKEQVDGFNVTMPLKQAIIPYLNTIDAQAALAGAVNTVVVKNGTLKGYNTDVDGLNCCLTQLPIINKTALVLGTGGAAKAAIVALQQQGFSVSISGRNPDQLLKLSQQFNIAVQPWLSHDGQELWFNATAVELTEQHYPAAIGGNIAFDLRYQPAFSAFLQRSTAPIKLNGLTMLIQQAAKAFSYWYQLEPNPAIAQQCLKEQGITIQ